MAAKKQEFGHEVIAHHLDDFLGNRPTCKDLENQNVVPLNYFDDPIASSKGKGLVRGMIESNLNEFHEKRPTLNDLVLKNIVPQEFVNYDNINTANAVHVKKRETIQNNLEHKLNHNRRPTITDLGDMHIIPHDYLDNLLEDAVTHHIRKESRLKHVQNRLEKHLPEPVAQTLAETLITSVQENDEEDAMDPFN